MRGGDSIVKEKSELTSKSTMQKLLTGMMVLLILQFIFGMIVNLYGVPPEQQATHPEPLFATISLGLHALIGLLIMIGAIFILVVSIKSDNKQWKNTGIYGFICILVAFMGGIATVTTSDALQAFGSLIMALGYLGSFIFIGKYYFLLINN